MPLDLSTFKPYFFFFSKRWDKTEKAVTGSKPFEKIKPRTWHSGDTEASISFRPRDTLLPLTPLVTDLS